MIDETLTLAAFQALAGQVAGIAYVKLVIDRPTKTVHFIADAAYRFHSDYVGEQILGVPGASIDADIDAFNESVYHGEARRFLIATLALHEPAGRRFLSLETVEIDDMTAPMIRELYEATRARVDPSLPIVFKPASHLQETIVAGIPKEELPRVLTHELYGSADYVALNPGTAEGRLRAFRTEAAYRRAAATLEWYDIVAMERVPEDVPRTAGLLSAAAATPLSHVNVLAHGWNIPNAVQKGVLDAIEQRGLDGRWVRYVVDADATEVRIEPLEKAPELARPLWSLHTVHVDAPETRELAIRPLDALRAADRDAYGTKAANLGELLHVLSHGSPRLLGFYAIARPPREHLLPHLAHLLGLPAGADGPVLHAAAEEWLRRNVRVPRGVALPFGLGEEVLRGSAEVQRALGRLSMAIELGAREVSALCLTVQGLVRRAHVPTRVRDAIDAAIAERLGGTKRLVLRSSSNAEDLPGFSAAGIYESKTHVETQDAVIDGLRDVWASLYSPRSVQLRREVGIPLDDACMGVIVQEEIATGPGGMGGVLVTSNPVARGDFRNVYANVSLASVDRIVAGAELPMQYLYNTVEGGGRTLSLGGAKEDLDEPRKEVLSRLALAGRLLQSHFSPDYAFATPLDIEWTWSRGVLWLLQVRPYGT